MTRPRYQLLRGSLLPLILPRASVVQIPAAATYWICFVGKGTCSRPGPRGHCTRNCVCQGVHRPRRGGKDHRRWVAGHRTLKPLSPAPCRRSESPHTLHLIRRAVPLQRPDRGQVHLELGTPFGLDAPGLGHPRLSFFSVISPFSVASLFQLTNTRWCSQC